VFVFDKHVACIFLFAVHIDFKGFK